jgi:3-hydroxyisobutyrate dehydrogenase-like beta-hydroxyacid dehydrogenase
LRADFKEMAHSRFRTCQTRQVTDDAAATPTPTSANEAEATEPGEIIVELGDDIDEDDDDEEPPRVAFLGMGVMGAPMARHVARAGHSVTVYNRTAAKALAWVALNGHGASPTPAEAAEEADVVMMCVGNDDDVREVVLGNNGVLNTMRKGSILIDHTTASAEMARELAAACAERDVGFVDAPVSGGQAGAENGQLTVMCGCDDEAVFEQVVPIIAHFAKSCVRLGDAGAGQLTKMVNQICIGGMIQGLAEAVNFAQRAGLDVEQVVDVISKGASQSWQMENRAVTMANGEFDFGFAVDWMRKDFGIVFDEASRNGARLPITALVDQFYAQIQQRGGERWDTSSLIDLLTNP